MASEDSMCLSASHNSNDLGSNNLSVDVLGKAVAVDHIEDGVFIMEDIGPPKGNQCDHTTANDTVNVHEKQVGVNKRVLEECNNNESSVRVVFSSLPSRSKRKLDEFLSQWSDWHAKQCASVDDSADSLESGEETYFPALHVGSDKMSTVSFSMDVPVLKRQRKESALLNQECTPVYDRGFAVGLATDTVAIEASGVDLREAPRCFNCGSYNHPLSGCTKPFNKDAVNSARKEFQSKRNQNSNNNPRVPTRYYQDSPAGKFDGLTPGALSAETRKVLSLGELDPPPWLNRMRELGYPPGYLGAEEDEEPSGITIFDDSETHSTAKRNSPPLGSQQSQNNMTIDFPGINSPIPKNADCNLWANRDLSPPFPRHSYENPFDFSRNQQPNYRQNFHGTSPPFSFGSPPVSQRPYDYHQSEPFSPIGLPIGLPIPASPRYGRPFMHHYSHGSF